MASTITLNVNNQNYTVTIPSTSMPLLWVIRDFIGLTGTKYGCGIEICGACTVLIDGSAEKSCDVKATEVIGKKITTVEGVAATAAGAKVQQAWVDAQVPQCGYCQSGMVMRATKAVQSGSHGASVANACNNLCVCGTYQRIKVASATL